MELRTELMPPVLDEELVVRLGKLARKLDGCNHAVNDCQALLAEFNREAQLELTLDEFQDIYGMMEHETWVRIRLSEGSIQRLSDITYDELLELTTRLCNGAGTEYEIHFFLALLKAQMPSDEIGDFIFWGNKDHPEVKTPKQILDLALSKKPIILPQPSE